MTMDYKMLAALLSSSHAIEAVKAVVQEADRVGFGPAVGEALQKAVAGSVLGDQALREEELRQAFGRLEWLGSGRNREAFKAFATYVNTISTVVIHRDAIADNEAFLLSARDENGAFIVSNPRVLEHIKGVGRRIDRMAMRYLSDPDAWSPIVQRASKDVGMMADAVRATVPEEFENPYHRFHALTQRTQELAIAVRATEAHGGEEARAIEALSFAINGAFEEGRFHDVIQLALEVWVRSVEMVDPPSEVKQESVSAVKIEGIREAPSQELFPAAVTAPVNATTMFKGVTIATAAVVFSASHPCTRPLK